MTTRQRREAHRCQGHRGDGSGRLDVSPNKSANPTKRATRSLFSNLDSLSQARTQGLRTDVGHAVVMWAGLAKKSGRITVATPQFVGAHKSAG